MVEPQSPEHGRVLVVDDEEVNLEVLELLLSRAGYRDVARTTRAVEALDLYEEFRPDVVLLDLMMPEMDGFELMRRLQLRCPKGDYLPILVLTADLTSETKRRALAEGAKDFLTKPFDAQEVLLRIRNMLEMRRLHLALREQNELLDQRVRERTFELEESYGETLERLALAAEYRDDETGQHILRVGRTAASIARELGLSEDEVRIIERAAGLHDVGKIGISDQILLAPRKLTEEEFEVVKTHTVIGAKLLSGSRSSLLQTAERIAWSHHERWDGTGYAGLAGESIPLVGRITTVADVFDALTHDRPYKSAWPTEQAIEEISAQRGRQFDPQVVEAFLLVQPTLDSSELERDTLRHWVLGAPSPN